MNPVDAAEIGESQRRLREIETRIDQNYRQLRGKEAREKTLRQDLKAVAREVSALEQRIGQEERKASTLLGSIKDKEEEIRQTQGALKEAEGRLKERLRVLYKEEETTLLQVFFSSSSPDAALEDMDFLGRIVQRDQELLSAYRAQGRKLAAGLQQLRELQGRQKDVLDGLKQDRESLGKAHSLNKRLLTQVAQEKKNLSREIAALRGRARDLTALIRKLEQARVADAVGKGDFAAQKGELMWPVKGPVRIAFGTRKHPDLETLYESQGIEIEAASEKPIAVVWSGKVAFANHFRGYGNLLIVNHGDGFHTLYAQASKLLKQVGDTVKRGEIIALSGFEGSRSVYFEIRHRGVPQNPAQWLKR
ncbi:MAG: peptidoglycan DD-metalloendopeptidase family protein [Desulfuromonadaceae bacterium]|nr:peptidoglycan DD-metalloendopeptidase family protein [Desulfuromonadaceae bacterium]